MEGAESERSRNSNVVEHEQRRLLDTLSLPRPATPASLSKYSPLPLQPRLNLPAPCIPSLALAQPETAMFPVTTRACVTRQAHEQDAPTQARSDAYT